MNRVTQYALDVLEVRIIAGNLVKLACQRHINDLERKGTEEFPFIFDEEKANLIIDYSETLTIAEGDEAFQLELADFQVFRFGSLNGWFHKDTGYRRFR
ncbi:terminase large subunit, partial [Bacillus tropicus]|nr:terminase large subunit [Bacillus tropicus]